MNATQPCSAQILGALLVATTVLMVPCWVSAQEPPPDAQAQSEVRQRLLTPAFGVRVGGYGFRQANGDRWNWFDCRMDGIGLMGTLDIGQHFFTELSVDFYQATPDVVESGMDRVSLHTMGALGLRMFPGRVFSPFIQVGGGVEWTKVQMDEHTDALRVAPTAFMGFGGEFRVHSRLKVGVGVRFLAMLHPEHSHDGQEDHDHGGVETFFPESSGPQKIDLNFAPAAQALGYLRYTL